MLGKTFFSGALNLKNSKRWPTWQKKRTISIQNSFRLKDHISKRSADTSFK